ncbi:hypothetical protein [Streptomyces sp. NPDC051572]|uniref:hypothetical protein n=1 Tax=Streptomyces sp. NPDC051572 TaxID=3155802 RepID=UPI00344D3930
MGTAIARRLGSGRTLFVVDASRGQLDRTVAALTAEGYAAHGVLTGSQAQFITGTDLLVDGGQAAWVRRNMRH